MLENKNQIIIKGVVVSIGRILLLQKTVNNDVVWVTPGGKIKNFLESDTDCLNREFFNSLPKALIKIDTPYLEFFDNESDDIKSEILIRVYFVSLVGGFITPSVEISRSRFFNYDQLERIPLSGVTRKIVDRLKMDCLIN